MHICDETHFRAIRRYLRRRHIKCVTLCYRAYCCVTPQILMSYETLYDVKLCLKKFEKNCFKFKKIHLNCYDSAFNERRTENMYKN